MDVEGNGRRPPSMVEVAVVPITDGQVRQSVSWMVRPAESITRKASRGHGITNRNVTGLRPVAGVADDIRAHLDGAVLVAHTAHIGMDMLTRELPGWEPAAVIDTLKLSRRVYPRRDRHTLTSLVDDLHLTADIPRGLRPHRATYDASATAHLLLRLAADGQLDTLTQMTGEDPLPCLSPDSRAATPRRLTRHQTNAARDMTASPSSNATHRESR